MNMREVGNREDRELRVNDLARLRGGWDFQSMGFASHPVSVLAPCVLEAVRAGIC